MPDSPCSKFAKNSSPFVFDNMTAKPQTGGYQGIAILHRDKRIIISVSLLLAW